MPIKEPDGKPGELFVIGGAESKLRRRTVLREFVRAAGGSDARIAIVPTASSLGPEIVEVYEDVFTKLGASSAYGVRPETREEAHSPALVADLDRATGIFMTGGNQLKLSSVICGTPFGDAIVSAHRQGITVGGTSAGASIQSSHMVAFGAGGATPKQRMTQVAAGLGLVADAVIDQHFEQRNRYGRLLMIVSQSPQLLGLGVDEDTAAIISEVDDNLEMRVAGRGSVTVFDGSRMVTNAYAASRSRPILASGVTLHVLPAGSRFSLTDRVLLGADEVAMPGAADELDEPTGARELVRLARDIAAGDVSPSTLRRRVARRTRGGKA